MIKKLKYLFLIVFAMCMANVSAANNIKNDGISVQAVNKKNFARIFFYCDQPVKFSTKIHNDNLKISFDREFSHANSRMSEAVLDYFLSVKLSDDGRDIIFKLADNNLRFRKFIGENFVGLDLIKEDNLALVSKTNQKKNKIATKPKSQPKILPKPRISSKNIAKFTKKFEQASIDATIELPELEPMVSNYEQQNKIIVYDKLRKEIGNDNFILLTLNEQESSASGVAPFDLQDYKAKITFQWPRPVGLASFVRGGYLWLLFDEYQEVDVRKIVINNDIIENGEQIYNGFYTILRLKLNEKIEVVTQKNDNDWSIILSDQKNDNLTEPKLSVKTSEMHGSRLLLQSDDAVRPIRMIDPEVGDEMIIVPYKTPNTAITKMRRYPDYIAPKTSQGAVFFLNADSTNIELTKKGVEIFGPTNKLAGGAQSALKELQERERQRQLKAQLLLKSKGDLTLVKFNSWKGDEKKTYVDNLRDFKWNLVEANWKEKSKPRLDLAKFYIAHRMGFDALGIVENIKESDEEFANQAEVKFLEAVSLYMGGRYRDSLRIFKEIDVNKIEEKHRDEFVFWLKATNLRVVMASNVSQFSSDSESDKSNKSSKEDSERSNEEDLKLIYETLEKLSDKIQRLDSNAVNKEEVEKLKSVLSMASKYSKVDDKRFEEVENSDEISKEVENEKIWWAVDGYVKADATKLDFIKYSNGFLKEYPDDIYNDFGFLALDYRLQRNNISVAEEIIASLKPETRDVESNNIKFYEALFYAKDDEDDRAIEIWSELAKNPLDRYNRGRSILAMTSFKLKRGTINNQEAIEQLNVARMAWRGGSFEFNLLQKLGDLYMEEKEYMEGFRVWREIVKAFPGTNESIYIAKKMSTKFAQIFSQVNNTELSKLDALTLYYEFRELTPIGKLGDDIVARIVDRLVEVDLLDRASAILAHQIRFRLSGEDRDSAASNLIRINLINHKPQEALDTLNSTYHDGLTDEDKISRKYMRALALTELGKNNMVLALLKDDDSEQAAFLRANVFWKNAVWHKVVDEMEATFRDIKREGKQLTQNQTDQMLRLAVSYALTGRKKKLNILYEDFSPLVANKDRKKLFSFVATDKGPVNFSDLKNTVEFDEMQSFLKQYIEADDQMSENPENL